MMIPAAMDIPPSLAERVDMSINDVGYEGRNAVRCGEQLINKAVQLIRGRHEEASLMPG